MSVGTSRKVSVLDYLANMKNKHSWGCCLSIDNYINTSSAGSYADTDHCDVWPVK